MPNKKKSSRDYFEIKAVSKTAAAIYLYDEIGWYDTDALFFKEALDKIGEINAIDLYINSPGGSVFEGIAIFNLLKSHPAKITVHIDGLAASMASYVAMVGDVIVMPENAIMMIHNPSMTAWGESKDMEKAKQLLDTAKSALIGAYAAKSGQTPEAISKIMDEETWLTSHQACEMGFCDLSETPIDAGVLAKFDLSAFINCPTFLKPSAVSDNPPQEMAMPQVNLTATAPNALELQKKFKAQEDQRKTEITASFGAFSKDHSALLIECLNNSETTVACAQSKLLAALGQGVAPVTGSHIQLGESMEAKKAKGFQAALMARAGLIKDDRSNEFRGMSMMEMAKDSLTARGLSFAGKGKMDIVAQAFTHGYDDFTGLLSDTANKAMLIGFEEAEESYEQFCSIGSLPDFKASKRVDLGSFPSLSEVREGAEYKSATIGDRGEQIQLASYGKLFSITRQAIINDDLNAFTRIPSKMGLAAKRTIGDLVMAILTANPTMADGKALFHSAHNNIGTGALASESLNALRLLMRTQKDGKATLNINPSFLIVPAALEGTAIQIMESPVEVSAAKTSTVPNQVRGLSKVIADARLDVASTTAFYLMAGKMFDTIEVAYLDGIATPSIEQQNGWGVDGVEFKVRMDAGVKALEYRTIAKSTGVQ